MARWACGEVTVTSDAPDVASVVRALSDANVQFVLVGEPAAGKPLRVVVSRHPTNLEALGRALDRLESTVRPPEATAAGVGPDDPLPRRVADPMGTIAVTTSAGEVDLIFGGPRRSLYAEVVLQAQERELGGLRVQWSEEIPDLGPVQRVTSRMLGRRLLSLAESLAHLIDRHDEPADGDADAGHDG